MRSRAFRRGAYGWCRGHLYAGARANLVVECRVDGVTPRRRHYLFSTVIDRLRVDTTAFVLAECRHLLSLA